MANWEELAQEILELITCRLTLEDFLAFRGVCSSWRSAATKETYKAKLNGPWFLTYVRQQKAEIFSPSGGRRRIFQLLADRVATMSPPGWLLVSKGDRDWIFNPLSGVSIELPSLERILHRSPLTLESKVLKKRRCGPNRIQNIALSLSPSSSSSYTAMISFNRDSWDHEPLGLAFLRSGDDAWTVASPAIHLPRSGIVALIHYQGLFFALDARNQLMTLDEREGGMQWRLDLKQCHPGRGYLVECSGSLLVAWKIKHEGEVPAIRVFEVDLEMGMEKQIKSLGSASLFLNYNSAFSVEFNAECPASCFRWIRPNHVYFTDYMGKKKIYSMDDGKVETYFDPTGTHRSAGEWFRPDF